MKNLIILLFLISSVSIFAKNPVKSNRAIEEVSWALESARWDYDQAMTLNFEEFLGKDSLDCEMRSYDEAMTLIRKAIRGFRGYFPDEELPFSEALAALDSILAGQDLEYCLGEDYGTKVWQIYRGSEYLFSVEQ
ncbi:hypothetical protein BIY24_10450 [Halobacteriovorax marinus]|uniref:hypothetical protein n=1 Tax=Halobacteriovorax marinus TaxID=97084 RepID=UPI000BC35CB1|nr:hypothetical protein [Halobacteriovorax marinus]ATH08352.1 hypothetical protein BIY24_10450 [Halobacteriovorax marinus]